jgi:hypothetical protein
MLPNSLIKFAAAASALMLWHTCHSENMARRGVELHCTAKAGAPSPSAEYRSAVAHYCKNLEILSKYYLAFLITNSPKESYFLSLISLITEGGPNPQLFCTLIKLIQ